MENTNGLTINEKYYLDKVSQMNAFDILDELSKIETTLTEVLKVDNIEQININEIKLLTIKCVLKNYCIKN